MNLDSTLLNTYGKQEGEGFNYHYQAHGYHPLLCYDGLTRVLLKAELRDGTAYSSTGVVDFMQPLLDDEIAEATKNNMIDYVVRYDEFLYQAVKWWLPKTSYRQD